MHNVVPILFAFIIAGCAEQSNTHIPQAGDTTQNADTTLASERLIPIGRSGDTIPAYGAMRKVEHDLNIHKLIYGYDSVQIRVFLVFSRQSRRQMITLSKAGENWRAEIRDIEVKSVTDSTAVYTTLDKKIIEPEAGWSDFIKGLYALGTWDMPDYRSLEGFFFRPDETVVVVEYATSEFYKIISYPSRPGETKMLPQEIQLEKIIQYLEKELDFARYNPENHKQ